MIVAVPVVPSAAASGVEAVVAAVGVLTAVAASSIVRRTIVEAGVGRRRPDRSGDGVSGRASLPVRALVDEVRGRRERRLSERLLPDVLEAVARALRGGASLAVAIDQARPHAPRRLRDDWRHLAAVSADEGVSVAAARWRAATGSPTVELAATALVVADQLGGLQARAIDGVAATLRSKAALEAELHALTASARASAGVLALAPVAFAVVASGLEPAYLPFLLGTPAGWFFLLAGGGLLAAGWWWMHRITASAS